MEDFNELLKKRQEEMARERENQHKESVQETSKMGNAIIGFLIGAGVFCVIGFILILIYKENFGIRLSHLFIPFWIGFSIIGGLLGARILYRS